ncbi:unnamed protein product [Echinostoma caproni]|uniref:26S proteasome non-ATPase regulatory subunit 2 n=1 Tax=Echinostoma caproni TaxID=27848 RepID=A0A183BEP8_9TREM|nr:unnamed protein product [Echinostoma caproni]
MSLVAISEVLFTVLLCTSVMIILILILTYSRTPEQVPALVSLLAESYHPHLRFGAAMAIGVACAGTASKEALTLLETLYEGTVPFVRQGALIATAMVLMQQNGVTCLKVQIGCGIECSFLLAHSYSRKQYFTSDGDCLVYPIPVFHRCQALLISGVRFSLFGRW